MANETLTPDGNTRNIAGAVTDDSSNEIRKLRIDDTSKGLKVMWVGGIPTFPQIILTANTITAVSNAATVPVTSKNNIVTNNSAAALTITLATVGAVSMQPVIVQILDASAVAQTITWINTEDSTITAPTASNGSTTLPLTVGFMFNSATSKWRTVASA